MATTKDVKSAAQRKERKVEAQQVASDQALADLAAINAMTRDDIKLERAATTKPKTVVSAKERKALAKKQAEEQAERDARMMAARTEKFGVLAGYKPVPGEVPPLHIQNALAQADAVAMKDEAREVANAAGKAAYDVVLGKTPRNAHTRQRRIAQMQNHAREQELQRQKQA